MSESYFGDRNVVLAGQIVAYEHYLITEGGPGNPRREVAVRDAPDYA